MLPHPRSASHAPAPHLLHHLPGVPHVYEARRRRPGALPNIDKEGANKHNNKRFFRSFALVLGTFAATLGITYYVPNVIFETFAVKVPVWYLLNQEVFVTTICSGAIAYLNCFYR